MDSLLYEIIKFLLQVMYMYVCRWEGRGGGKKEGGRREKMEREKERERERERGGGRWKRT